MQTRLLASMLLASTLLQWEACVDAKSAGGEGAARSQTQQTTFRECPETPGSNDWQIVELGNVATVRVPPDARGVTGAGAGAAWRLGEYGGVGYSVRSREEAVLPTILADTSRAAREWCTAQSGDDRFIARVFDGHTSTGLGRHLEAYWTLPDGRELIVRGLTDPSAGNVLLQIARSVRLRQH